MTDFDKIKLEISEKLKSSTGLGSDLSDIGNEIGFIIAEYIDNNKLGYDLDDFISGVEHGASIKNGTHP
jgi:hypothetical protein